MRRPPQLIKAILGSFRFASRVVAGFRANQGFLLAGAVAYYTLLSIVPMLAVILVALSQLVSPDQLLGTLRTYLDLLAPGQAAALTEQVEVLLDQWQLVGAIGLLALLFFSSLAFTVLENAMSVIFSHRVVSRRRRLLTSAVLPYAYIVALTFGLLMISGLGTALHALGDRSLRILGHTWSMSGYAAVAIHGLGTISEILLLTSLYVVMPVGHLPLRHALIGGASAALLWEVTRHFLVWYFSTLSMVNVIYGSFATVIVILLSLEAAALIVLLGAQVIAEYERAGTDQERARGLRI